MKVGTFLLLIVIVVVLLFFGYSASPASPEDLQAVVAAAEKSPDAKKLVVDTLKNEPVPSNSSLAKLRGDVDKLLARDISRAATGVSTLQVPQVPVSAPQPRTEAEEQFLFLVKIVVVFMGFVAVVLALFRIRGNVKDGRGSWF